MNEELQDINHNIDITNMNGMDCSDNNPEDCRPMHSKDFTPNMERMRINMTPTSGDNHSMCSSKSSIKSHVSEDRSDKKRSDSRQRRVLPTKDQYCWDCHKLGVEYSCKTCLRSYHKKCPSLKKLSDELQSCPECIGIMQAEEGTNPSGCMQWLNGNVDRMAELLEYTIITVKTADRNQSFHKPVSTEDYPQYLEFIVNPMDLSLVEENVKNKTYASTNSFLADIKWIYHNCYIFNSGDNNRLISEAKNIIRVAKQEAEEIEICPDCYLNYYTLEEETYFAAVCARPHAIVWAKLKGHPYWPAKVVRYNESRDEVDIRFFGTHDKCWLKPNQCFLISKNYPNNKKPIKFDEKKFDEAIRDMNLHLDQLELKFKNLFRFHDKQTIFTVDKLYLNRDQIPTPTRTPTKGEMKAIIEQKESPKKVLNNYNGIPLKPLSVKASAFDIKKNIIEKDSTELPNRSPPKKRFKTSPKSPIFKKKCFSTAISMREEMSSSLESDQSFTESRDGSKNDRSFTSNNSFGRQLNSSNHLIESQLNSSISDANESIRSPKATQILSQSQTVIVSGNTKSSQNLSLNNLSKKIINETIDNSNKILIDFNDSSSKASDPSSQLKTKSTQKNKTSEELLKKIKSLEFKNRKLSDELNVSKSRVTALEEECDELKKSNEELQNSIPDIKKKQWCTNCSKEAILPCCWNTCYCTVECQHQHWPTHSKLCRRRQQHQQQTRN